MHSAQTTHDTVIGRPHAVEGGGCWDGWRGLVPYLHEAAQPKVAHAVVHAVRPGDLGGLIHVRTGSGGHAGWAVDHFLGYSPPHGHIQLRQQLRTRLVPLIGLGVQEEGLRGGGGQRIQWSS